MSTDLDDLIERFRQTCDASGESEQHVLAQLTQNLQVSRDTNREFDDGLTFGQRLADRVAGFVGSWVFILLFVFLLLAWVVLNSVILARVGKAFDLYPYILLNLFLSMVAALQAPLIMMSQNRQAAKDRLEAKHNYEVSLKAELEIMTLHQKIDWLYKRHQRGASTDAKRPDPMAGRTGGMKEDRQMKAKYEPDK